MNDGIVCSASAQITNMRKNTEQTTFEFETNINYLLKNRRKKQQLLNTHVEDILIHFYETSVHLLTLE